MIIQVQIIITRNNIVKQVPTFVLPTCLGLTTYESAKSVVESMFADYEVHGTLWNSKGQVFSF